MSKQTSMQQLKDFCEYRLTKATNENKSAWNMILAKIKDDGLIEMEKQQLIDAHTKGYIIGGGNGDLYDCKQYYNDKFNK